MKDMLVCMIYYHYITEQQYSSTQGGIANNAVETGATVSYENAARAGEIKWNTTLNTVGAIQFYIKAYNPDPYPTYNGVIFKPKFSALL